MSSDLVLTSITGTWRIIIENASGLGRRTEGCSIGAAQQLLGATTISALKTHVSHVLMVWVGILSRVSFFKAGISTIILMTFLLWISVGRKE